MKNIRKFLGSVLVLALIASLTLCLFGCNDKNNVGDDGAKETLYDMETRPFLMSISTPDGVFSPYFSSSAYDSSIVGMTQIGMLSTDKEGNIVAGENEPCVTKDFVVTEHQDEGYTTYEFLIKNGIKFSDGVPLTIKDVLFNLYVYLDPAYTGSSTIYSTESIGLKSYRQQQAESDLIESSAFEDKFAAAAEKRILNLTNYVKQVGKGVKQDERPTTQWSDADKAAFVKDYKYVAEKFKEELVSDWNSSEPESYKDNGFKERWQVFFLNDGGYSELLKHDSEHKLVKDEKGNVQLDEEEAARIWEEEILVGIEESEYASMSQEEAVKEYCINSVYESYFPETDITLTDYNQFVLVINHWGTANTVREEMTVEAKSDYFAKTDKIVPSITGVTTGKVTSFKGVDYDEEFDVLRIDINKVDPKAIYNFAFTVSPMHYYSGTFEGKDYVAAFDGETEFGLKFGSKEFMDTVINAKEKVGLPMGAGVYMATNAAGKGEVTAANFFNNNIVYYERNPYFNTVGKELSNAKIKYVRYKVVASDQIINALSTKEIDFGDPSATQENIAMVEEAGLTHIEIKTSGYGYVGINPRFVPNILVRRIIMTAMNTQLITNEYYQGGLAELIYRPMSTTSWAYPKGCATYVDPTTGFDYSFDRSGKNIETLLERDGYELNADGVYHKNIPGFGDDVLSGVNYTFTIAGGSTDHPAYKMFIDAMALLNKHGFNVKVVTSQTALSDLSNGKLAVWAAAWSSAIDPDMYQIYHVDSQASSTSNWGYKQIKAGKDTVAYSEEYQIIRDLSDLIDEGRETTDVEQRKAIYANALDKIMELAVEMPTYQRKDMSAFNGDVLDESSMTPASERTPYNGLLSRIWEVSYK